MKFLSPILKKAHPEQTALTSADYVPTDKMELYHGLVALQLILCCICVLATFCPGIGRKSCSLLGKVEKFGVGMGEVEMG